MSEVVAPENEPSNLLVRGATRVFLRVEHSVYVALGGLLAIIAILALIHSGIDVWRQVVDWDDPDRILDIMDGLLFILMLVEILHTVRVSIRSGSLTCEPFLIVGLIASIRRVLVITLEFIEGDIDRRLDTRTRAVVPQFDDRTRRLGLADHRDGRFDLYRPSRRSLDRREGHRKLTS